MLDQNPSDIQVKPNETVELKIAFEVPRTADEYMFYIESSLDPLQTYWKIDKCNHKQTKSKISKSNEKFNIDTNEYYINVRPSI